MAKMRRGESKGALGRQRAEIARGSRHQQFVGQNEAAALGHESELAKVREMRDAARTRDRLDRPIVELLAEVAGDTFRLARTLAAFPFRLAAALRGRRASEA